MIHTRISPQNTPAFIHKENMHTEIPLVTHTYNIMTLIIKTLLHLQTHIQHYYCYICHVWHRQPPFPMNLHEPASLQPKGMQAKYSAGLLH